VASAEWDYVKIIVGLGNPGKDYQKTRHNLGFQVVDLLTERIAGPGRRTRFRAELIEGQLGPGKVVLAKPQMYMNLSGIPVRELVGWYKIDLADLLIIYDDMDLPLGQLRMRGDGSAGGHNGMRSIITELGSNEFPRLRIGIGRGGGASVAHVLSRFSDTEIPIVTNSLLKAADAADRWIEKGLTSTMNDVNQPKPPTSGSPEEHSA
jgi:PTH1 family peptidyl-tRNA hydrolase